MAPKRKRKAQNQPVLTAGSAITKSKVLKTEDPVVDANLPVLYIEHCRS